MIIEYKNLIQAYIVYKRLKNGLRSMLAVDESREIAIYKALKRI